MESYERKTENDSLESDDENKQEASFQFSLAELGSSITSSLESSVAAAEFRALEFVELDNWEISDLKEILFRRDILVNDISWSKIERQLYLGKKTDRVYSADFFLHFCEFIRRIPSLFGNFSSLFGDPPNVFGRDSSLFGCDSSLFGCDSSLFGGRVYSAKKYMHPSDFGESIRRAKKM